MFQSPIAHCRLVIVDDIDGIGGDGSEGIRVEAGLRRSRDGVETERCC